MSVAVNVALMSRRIPGAFLEAITSNATSMKPKNDMSATLPIWI